MIKIKCFSSFCNSKECKNKFESVNKSELFKNSNFCENYCFTENNDYTHAIILNTAMPKLSIPKQNVLGLAFEPIPFLGLTDEFVEYAKKYIGRYFIGDCNGLPEPFIERYSYMWYTCPPREIVSKTKLMSIIISNKTFAPGHVYRHELVKNIIRCNLPIDIYGRGSNFYKYQTVKGPFNNDVEPYGDYMFTICIENFITNEYFSEKIISPIMYNCMPIYIGCRNIDKYLENYLLLTGNTDNDIKILTEIINNPLKYYKRPYSVKNFNSVNLTANLHELFPK